MNDLWTTFNVMFFLCALGFIFVFWKKARSLEKKYHGRSIEEAENKLSQLKNDYLEKKAIYDALCKEVEVVAERVSLEEVGMSDAVFEFDTIEEYQLQIEDIREKQKNMIKDKVAVYATTSWTVNGSKREGQKLINENVKLTLRAFNNDCDITIKNVTWRNFETSKSKIHKAFEFYNKHNETNSIVINSEYRNLKLRELELCYEQEEKKKQIKDEQRAIREQIREEERFEKDRLQAEKEEKRYKDLLAKAQQEAEKASGAKLETLNLEVEKLKGLLAEAEAKNIRALSMAQQTKAGHVYVISNIGSFGEGVFKIGMTRRLDPYDRVHELGDASVPFEFDVHAMISCENAPELENILHRTFEKQKMNLVNNRKEFFKVSLEEIEQEVRKHRPEVNLVRTALAEQYYRSEMIRQQLTQQTENKEAFSNSSFPNEL